MQAYQWYEQSQREGKQAERIYDDKIYRDYQFSHIYKHGIFKRYCFTGKSGVGKGEMLYYEVFPGVNMTYDYLEADTCFQDVESTQGYLQINYCLEGCFEFELKNGQVTFMGEGDICLCNPWSKEFIGSRLPLGHYKGITFFIKMDEAQRSMDEYFPHSSIDLQQLAQRISLQGFCYLFHAEREIEQIFVGLSCANECIMQPYCATKLFELLLLIELRLKQKEEHLPHFSLNVVSQTKTVFQHIMLHPDEKLSIRYLCEEYCVAQSALQQCFKCIYGKPIGSFVRQQRMQHSAALLLEQPTISIGELAQRAGYENQSKFSAAFKAVMGQSPLKYRQENVRDIM